MTNKPYHWIVAGLTLILTYAFQARASVQQTISEQSSIYEVNARFVRFVGGDATISTSGYGAGYTRYISPKLGLNFDVGQLFGKSNGKTSAIVTSFGFSVKFRPFASHQIYRETIALDGQSFISTNYARAGGAHLSIGMTQQLLNAADGVVPYNGLSFGIGYDLPFGESWLGQVSVNQANPSNDKATVKIMSAMCGLAYTI